jgi:hypothetical protein
MDHRVMMEQLSQHKNLDVEKENDKKGSRTYMYLLAMSDEYVIKLSS